MTGIKGAAGRMFKYEVTLSANVESIPKVSSLDKAEASLRVLAESRPELGFPHMLAGFNKLRSIISSLDPRMSYGLLNQAKVDFRCARRELKKRYGRKLPGSDVPSAERGVLSLCESFRGAIELLELTRRSPFLQRLLDRVVGLPDDHRLKEMANLNKLIGSTGMTLFEGAAAESVRLYEKLEAEAAEDRSRKLME